MCESKMATFIACLRSGRIWIAMVKNTAWNKIWLIGRGSTSGPMKTVMLMKTVLQNIEKIKYATFDSIIQLLLLTSQML